MRQIGVISDTHGQLREEALRELEGSELILHAGDVGDLAILDRLREIAPVWAVRGNTDYGEVGAALSWFEVVDLLEPDGRVRRNGAPPLLAYVHHGHRYLELDPAAAGFRLVVQGHTHLPLIEERGGILFLNPGSAGPRRSGKPVSLARVSIDSTDGEVEMKARIVDLSAEVV